MMVGKGFVWYLDADDGGDRAETNFYVSASVLLR